MQFSDIAFAERGGRYGSQKWLRIGGYWASRDLVDLMWQRTQQVLPTVDWSTLQTAKSLFGDDEEWQSHSVGARIALGRSLKYFVDHDMLPVKLTNPGKSGPRKYSRK